MMTLREKQSLFVKLVGMLISYAYSKGYELTFGDAYATSGHKENSNHYSRLAIDLNLFQNGIYLTHSEAHRPLGEYWESLHPLCRWGNRFKSADGNHYSLEHNGRA